MEKHTWQRNQDFLQRMQVLPVDDVFVVWLCKTLQNSKALLSTTLLDGMYYEITYNGHKRELYFDAYKKWENRCIMMGDD